MAAPSAADTWTAGTQWRSATTSSSGFVLASTMPTPPASRTTLPFSTRAFCPRWQSTALPATAAAVEGAGQAQRRLVGADAGSGHGGGVDQRHGGQGAGEGGALTGYRIQGTDRSAAGAGPGRRP